MWVPPPFIKVIDPDSIVAIKNVRRQFCSRACVLTKDKPLKSPKPLRRTIYLSKNKAIEQYCHRDGKDYHLSSKYYSSKSLQPIKNPFKNVRDVLIAFKDLTENFVIR